MELKPLTYESSLNIKQRISFYIISYDSHFSVLRFNNSYLVYQTNEQPNISCSTYNNLIDTDVSGPNILKF